MEATNTLFHSVVVIATGILAVAVLSVLLSKNSTTPQVIQASGQAFGADLGVAISPTTGNKINFSPYFSSGLFGANAFGNLTEPTLSF